MKEFGAYLQVYKNPYATYKCLESFRALYPHNTIVLVSDNGYFYEKMAQHFNCIYIHSYSKAKCIVELNEDYITNSFNIIDRFCNALSLIKEDYVIWLEDDVIINNKVNDELLCDINGYCPNMIFSNQDNIDDYIINHNIDIKAKYTGHGGSIFNRNQMLKYLSNKLVINYILSNWINWNKYGVPTNICQDYLFSIITIFNGGTIGPLNNHRDSSILNKSIDIQHQYKVYYNLYMPSELSHLIDTTY